MLDAIIFEARLAQYLIDFELRILASWALSDNVFVAQVMEKDDEGSGFVFFHDVSETHFRSVDRMCREMQLLSADAECGMITEDKNDTLGVMYFWGSKVANCPFQTAKNAFHAATQLLMMPDGQEIAWYSDAPREMK